VTTVSEVELRGVNGVCSVEGADGARICSRQWVRGMICGLLGRLDENAGV
jgi:hypothetical protein